MRRVSFSLRACHVRVATSTLISTTTAAAAALLCSMYVNSTQGEQSLPPPNCPSSPPTAGRPPSNPMEVLHGVFQAHPSALRLHRALTIALATGRVEEAADTAAALAQTVTRVLAAQSQPIGDGSVASTALVEKNAAADAAEAPPQPTVEDVTDAINAAERAVLHGAAAERSSPHARSSSGPAPGADVAFWHSPEHLTVTLLESAFETELPEGDGAADPADLTEAGNRAMRHEQQQMTILGEYLEREKDRWDAQKRAIAKVVLDVAKKTGLTPLDLHAAESSGGSAGTAKGPLNVLRHANIVLRGEAPAVKKGPDADGAAALATVMDEELRVLKERMAMHHQRTLTPEEETMARYELVLANTTMRYVVGLHRDVQDALEQSQAVSEAREAAASRKGKSGNAAPTNSAFFVQEVMEALHQDPETTGLSVESAELASILSRPVLPFTFMLKCCLWFTVPDAK